MMNGWQFWNNTWWKILIVLFLAVGFYTGHIPYDWVLERIDALFQAVVKNLTV